MVRYLAAGAIALVVLALLAVIGLSIAHGIELTAPSVVGLLAFVGTLIGLIANLVGTQNIAVRLADVQDKVNGHLQAHIGHTDQQVQALVDDRLRGLAQQQTTIAPPPPAGEGEG